MTFGRRSAVLASAAAVPIVVILLLAMPLILPTRLETPPASNIAIETDPVHPSDGPETTLLPTPRPIERTIAVTEHRTRGPFGNRIRPTGVWTDEEVIVWGGWIGRPFGVGPPRPDGAAYNPDTDRWRRIAEAPIPPSAGAIAAWTGKEMLIWDGSTSVRPPPRPTGAAYDPASDTWRTMADAPLRLGFESAAVWTGEEWVLGVERVGAIQFAAYDPEGDAWRRLPDLPGDTDESRLEWTGSEILISTDNGMYRLLPGAEEWIPSADPVTAQQVGGPVSVDGRIIGLHPERGLVEWTPSSDTWASIAMTPRPLQRSGFTTVGDGVLVVGDIENGRRPDLAFDLDSGEWWELSWPEVEHRRDHVDIWAGNQLFTWGGWVGGPTGRPAFQYGVLYSPDW